VARRPTLQQFIAECLLVDEKQDLYGVKKCTGFALVHERGGAQHELKTIRIGARAWDPKELADILESTAETFAGGVPGVQQFQVLAFFDDQGQPQSFYPFRKSGGDIDHGGLATEPPTTSGLMQQLMRLFEANTRITHQYSSAVFATMERAINKLDDRCARLEQEQHDTIELAKELVFQKASNEHGFAIARIEAEQKANDRATVMRLLPPVVNRITGKEIFPQASADSAIIDQMAESLTQQQIQQLAGILTKEQWGLLADRLVQSLERKAAREKASGRVNGGSDD